MELGKATGDTSAPTELLPELMADRTRREDEQLAREALVALSELLSTHSPHPADLLIPKTPFRLDP